ncbi:MAG: BrnT family toxin [Moraxellaceae bacterium]|nr:BrnT family toxin [Moraxellaceae bacterium]
MPTINYRGMIFEWNDNKFHIVLKDRGITFEDVCVAFFDPNAKTVENDIDEITGEERYMTIGMTANFQILSVVWVERGDTIRIITAFKSSHQQRKYYEQSR